MELMTVVTVIGVVSTVGFASMSGSGNAGDTAALARGLQFLAMRARQEAAGDNRQRQIDCTLSMTASTCTLSMAQSTGMGAPAAWTPVETLKASSHAWLWAVNASVDRTGPQSPAQEITPQVTTFYPDGTVTGPGGGAASGATFYVCDRKQTNKYKVYVYGGTSMSRLVTNW